jgi:hypothetical protein
VRLWHDVGSSVNSTPGVIVEGPDANGPTKSRRLSAPFTPIQEEGPTPPRLLQRKKPAQGKALPRALWLCDDLPTMGNLRFLWA